MGLPSDGERPAVAASSKIVVAPPELDLESIDAFRAALSEYRPEDSIIVDFRDVSFCDSTGINAIVGAWKRHATAGGQVRAINMRPTVRRVFELTKVADLIDPTS
jgi:anti-sigma B factor antagonist